MSDSNTEEETSFSNLILKKLENKDYFLELKAKLRAQISLALEEDTTPTTPETPVKLNDETLISLALINDFLQTLNLKYTSSVFQSETSTLTSSQFQSRTELANMFDLGDIEQDIPILTKILPPTKTTTIEIQKILKDDDTNSSV